MKTLKGKVFAKFLEGYTWDQNGVLTEINEDVAAESDNVLKSYLLEMARQWWDELESAEDSLSGLSNEIRFEEMNADPSAGQMTRSASSAPKTPMMTEAKKIAEAYKPTEFDLTRLFENAEFGDEQLMDSEGEGEEESVDGDEDYENMRHGMDDAGMGEGHEGQGDEMDLEGHEDLEGDHMDDGGIAGEHFDAGEGDMHHEGDEMDSSDEFSFDDLDGLGDDMGGDDMGEHGDIGLDDEHGLGDEESMGHEGHDDLGDLDELKHHNEEI